jgi:ATP-dependent protease ClpP protease subunit
MSKQILLYGHIDSYNACEFNETLQELETTDEVVLRINTTGGSPEYGWGIISMFKDLPNAKKVKVDGQAHSMGAFILCYVNEAEALDVSEFLIHRASYGSYFETSEMFDDSLRGNLERINASLEKAFRAKVDVEAFEEMKGVKVKDVFSMESRIDVFLSAKEAKKIGLISKIIPLTAAASKEIETFAKAASSNGIKIPKMAEEITNIKITNKMTAAEFKAANPEAYAAIQNEAVSTERDRVGSLMAFHDIDPSMIVTAIKEGSVMTATMTAELTRKSIAKNAVKALEADSPEAIVVEGQDNEKTEAEKAAAKSTDDFFASAKKYAVSQIA